MPTTASDIKGWIERGKANGATHLIVACDTFDWEDYPVFVYAGQNAREKAAEYDGKNMQKLMEVYNLDQNIEKQLKEHRSFNY